MVTADRSGLMVRILALAPAIAFAKASGIPNQFATSITRWLKTMDLLD